MQYEEEPGNEARVGGNVRACVCTPVKTATECRSRYSTFNMMFCLSIFVQLSSSMKFKESFMAPLNMQLMDDSHLREVKKVCVCVCACVRACVRACVHVCMRDITHFIQTHPQYLTEISDPRGGEECPIGNMVYREG